MLTTRDIVKANLNLTGDSQDALVDQAISAVSGWIAGELHRLDKRTSASLLERQVDRVEYPESYDAGYQIRLDAYPIESITEIKQSYDRDFGSATALVEDTDFVLDTNRSDVVVHLRGGFYSDKRVLRVTYTGGYWSDLDTPAPVGAASLPPQLSHAATLMAAHLFSNRKKLGEKSFSAGDMTVSGVKDDILKVVERMIAPFKRYG